MSEADKPVIYRVEEWDDDDQDWSTRWSEYYASREGAQAEADRQNAYSHKTRVDKLLHVQADRHMEWCRNNTLKEAGLLESWRVVGEEPVTLLREAVEKLVNDSPTHRVAEIELLP